MDLDITDFFNTASPRDYSASVAEIGRDAGRATWQAACDDAPDYPVLDTDEKREAFRAFVKSSGCWSDEEVSAWSDTELNALCLQWVAGDMREGDLSPIMSDADWQNYADRCADGRLSSRIFGGPMSIDGRVYFNMDT